jgi:hypothetical protein
MVISTDIRALFGFFDFHYFAALIVAALGADAVRQFPLVTIRALGNGNGSQKIMGAANRSASLRMTPFWIWHGNSLSMSRPALEARAPLL